jgi:UDP-glucose 4-epimerase
MNVLVTGGAGYIGSHACQRLLAEGHTVVAVDNLFRGHAAAIQALRASAPGGTDRLHFERLDIVRRDRLEEVMRTRRVDSVMHFAALAYVGESVEQPLRYYRNNVEGAISLLEACNACNVQRFVFSSTCATYGEPDPSRIPISESTPQNPINPYGRTKLHAEQLLADYARMMKDAKRPFAFAALRYFNLAGCDRTGVLGEHHEPETHLIPVILQAALGKREFVQIHGTDYPTPDGTCIRDYIHVEDLIDAHVRVLGALQAGEARVYNLGIGRGYSVREILDAARRVTRDQGKPIVVKEGPRRPGDPPILFANPEKIRRELGWSAKITDLDEIIASAWRWFVKNPSGYPRIETP